MDNAELYELARSAGIDIVWRDVAGIERRVSDDSLRDLLNALELPSNTGRDIKRSQEAISRDRQTQLPPLLTSEVGLPIPCKSLSGMYKVQLESGGALEGRLNEDSILPGIDVAGYHQIEAGGQRIELAVAPRRSFTIADIPTPHKMWGLAVQLYSLRQKGDGGIGDFGTLASFVRAAAKRGADAVAISPVHAQFSSDTARFGPYAPSSRTAFNIMHICEPSAFHETASLVDWPAAAAAKLAALRQAFKNFNEDEALDAFIASSGPDLEQHAVFEAINQLRAEQREIDWRSWPAGLQNPNSLEVAQFKRQYAEEIRFHAYLQFRADREMAGAQRSAREAGMRIGLIADLAVGTDRGGSQSWSRQGEVLDGVEVGAPPDAINRSGQSWGITAFSPRGLRESGFSAFIEMLRHALRHAGGLRVDHVMGLSRLWLIPQGRSSAEGAYLRMPKEELIRLVRLESYRHQAIILGEDLGTLPDGFQSDLDSAGIAGLRVLWFEKSGNSFNPPSTWSKTAVAMTSTHDLPTIAGWWRGQDILWRDRLGMAGDDVSTRDLERGELWDAFVAAGVSSDTMPRIDETDIVADAACAFLAKSASALALLPIEDALGEIEQPNLPGTTDEHPNWRRRLPDEPEGLLSRPDVASRLARVDELRKAQ